MTRTTRALTALTTLTAAIALAAPALGGSSGARLVVRGDDTVVDHPCRAGLCAEAADATFRGTLGTGAYTAHAAIRLADAFPNGEGGVCAPFRSRIVLGAGSANELVLAVNGSSCQDGAGNPTQTSFTGVGRFRVVGGTGAYAGAHGSGVATFLEDAADHEHMTLIGRLAS
jgi:hypothetical protein